MRPDREDAVMDVGPARNEDTVRPEFDVGDTVTLVHGRHRTRTTVRAISMVSPCRHHTNIRYHLACGAAYDPRYIAESYWYAAWLAEREPGAVVEQANG